MCQPQSRGGRRCPNHQPGTVGTSRFVVENYGLTKEQVKGTFVSLRAQGQGMPAPTVEQYEHFKQRQLQILENSNLDETTKNKVRTQLNRRLNAEQLPDGPTFYAQRKMIARSREQKREFVGMIKQIAEAQNVNRREARQLFDERYEQLSAIPGVTNPGDQFDRRTLAAVATLTSRNAETGQRLTSETPRIQRQDVSDRSTWVHEIGYDPDDGRLEIKTQNSDKVYAYHNVPRRLWQKISNGDEMGSTISREIFRNPLYAYESAEAAERDSSGRWCYDCHSYRAVSGHTCIPRDLRQGHDQEDTTASNDSIVSSAQDSLNDVVEHDVEAPTDVQETSDYEAALAKIKQQLAASDDGDVPDDGLTVQQRRWMTPVEDRETQHFESFYHIGANTKTKRVLLTSGQVIEASMYEFDYDTYQDVQIQMKFWAEGENGLIKSQIILPTNISERRRNRFIEEYEPQLDNLARAINPSSYIASKVENGEQEVKISEALGRDGYSYHEYQSADGAIHLPIPQTSSLKTYRQALEDNPNVSLNLGNFNSWSYQSFPNLPPTRWGEMSESIETTKDFIMFKDANGDITYGVGPTRKCWRKGCSEPAPCSVHARDQQLLREFFNDATTNGRDDSTDDLTMAEDLRLLPVHDKLEELSKLESQEWVKDASLVEAYQSHFPDTNPNGFNANLDSYLEEVHAAEQRQKNGESVLPFVSENATNGFCSPESGRGFGIEIEYDLPQGQDAEEVLDAIAKDLYNDGLSDIDHSTEYHGYSGNEWHIEDDCTVAGEVVSPILHDTPEDWEKVARVCEIIKRHGGKATARTGGHVHMGLKSDSKRPGLVKASLVQLFSVHQDSILRVNADPNRKKHRGTQWCNPLDKQSAESQVYDFVHDNLDEGGNDHSKALNLAYDNRVEFRSGDGSLDPGHIQAQVMLSAALMRKAEASEHMTENAPYAAVGTNAKRSALLGFESKGNRSDEQIIVEDLDFRKTTDALFDDDNGRKMMASIAAINPWQELER